MVGIVVGVTVCGVLGVAPNAARAASPVGAAAAAVHRGRGHAMPRFGTQALQTAGSAKSLTYYGGAVVTAPKVYLVEWGTGTYYPQVTDGRAGAFFGGTLGGPYMDWLSEYDTPTQTIGRGTFAGTVSITPSSANNGSTIDDTANIQTELQSQIAAHHLPAQDANTIYFLYFRQGQVITQGNGNSLTQFCAYHNTIAGSPNIRYAVMPYIQGPGCGNDADAWNNMQSVASHELVETVTDPDVGLASTLAPPLGWYNSAYGEIGDICNASQGRVTGGDANTYVVQNEWSNQVRTCLATRRQSISVGDATVVEGDAKTRAIKFAVTLSEPATATVTVSYRLGGGTAIGAGTAAPGVDYNNGNGVLRTLTFALNATTGLTPVEKFISVPVYADTTPELTKTFNVVLSNSTGPFAIARSTGTGTIIDDDVSTGVRLTVGDAAGTPGDAGIRAISVPITLSAAVAVPVTVNYAISGTGANAQFVARNGTITFPAGAVAKFATVTILADGAPQPGETFTLTLSGVNSNGVTVVLARQTGTGAILTG